MTKLTEQQVDDYKVLIVDMIENEEEFLEECKHDNLFELSLILSELKVNKEDRKLLYGLYQSIRGNLSMEEEIEVYGDLYPPKVKNITLH